VFECVEALDDIVVGTAAFSMNFAIVFVCTAFVELYVLRRLRFDWVIVALVVAGTLLSVDYATYTSIAERNYDGAAQVEYIQAFADSGRPPDVFACVDCGHPPLYYALAAGWSKLTLVAGFMPLALRLQWLSLLLFFAFVAFALLIFRSRGGEPSIQRFAAALLVFWPSSIINSVRVHNDALASPLLLAATYFIAEWDEHGRKRDFYAALAACALSLMTKSTGYAVAATLVVFLALQLRAAGSARVAAARLLAAIAVLVVTEFLAVGSRASRRPTSLCLKIFGHACDGRHVPPVPDTVSRFFAFDMRDFIGNHDALHLAHDYLLNRLLKSSLFGVAPLGDDFAGGWYAGLATAISVLFLAMVAACLFALPFMRGVGFRRYRVYLVACAVMFASLLAFRVAMPNEYHEDFRHIFAALVTFCLGYTKVVSWVGRLSLRLQHVGICIALLMIAA